MGTAIKHPMPDWVKPSFVIFDIRALLHSALSVKSALMSKITNDGLAQDAFYMYLSHMAALGVKG